jgi:parvulin-like peptidyl-prolyl isomerase
VPVPVDSITDVPTPSAEDLAQYHDAHEAQFTAPEYRALTFVTLKPEDLVDEVDVSEEEIQAAYQSRTGEFRTPERRTVEQLLASDQAKIEQAAERLAAGATFEQVASEIEGVRVDQLGTVKKGDLPAAFEQAIFSQTEGQTSAPVNSAFGWHIFRVTKIEPETTMPLAEAHAQLAKELALQQASDRLPDFAAQLDDELAAGTPLKEAAQALGLQAASDQLVEGWQAERRRELARQKAEQLRARLADGAPLDEVLTDAGLESKPIEPVRREAAGSDQGINRQVVRALFATKPGAVADDVIEVGDAFAVVATDEVIAADPAADAEGVKQLAGELEADMRADLLAQYETQLRRDYPVEIDGAAINRLIGPEGLPSPPSRPATLPSDAS